MDTAIENNIEGTIFETSIKWLEEKLTKSRNKPVIIFMHHPPIEIGSLLFDHINCNNGDEFIKLISKYQNVKEVIFGHVHCFFDKIINGIKFSSCPSASIQYPIDAKSDKNIQLDTNGYVKIIPSHKDHGKGYDDIDVSVHGGLTFSETILSGDEWPEGHWVGFDTAHSGDDIKLWPKESVLDETKDLFSQIYKIKR